MEITTNHNPGDKILIDGVLKTIRGVQVYISKNVITERYYLGNLEWTIKTKRRRARNDNRRKA